MPIEISLIIYRYSTVVEISIIDFLSFSTGSSPKREIVATIYLS